MSLRSSRRPRHRTHEGSGEEILRVEGLVKHFPIRAGLLKQQVGQMHAVDGVDLSVARRRDARPRRRVRLRQVHPRPLDPAADRADRGHDLLRRHGHHRLSRAPDARGPPRDADRLPGPVRVAEPAHDRRARSSPSRSGSTASTTGEAGASASRSCCAPSASRRSTPTASRTSSRAASGSASASPARSRSTRSCSSSTSPCRRSTSRSRRRSSTCSRRCSAISASPTSSSRTTSPSSATSPTASP